MTLKQFLLFLESQACPIPQGFDLQFHLLECSCLRCLLRCLWRLLLYLLPVLCLNVTFSVRLSVNIILIATLSPFPDLIFLIAFIRHFVVCCPYFPNCLRWGFIVFRVQNFLKAIIFNVGNKNMCFDFLKSNFKHYSTAPTVSKFKT